jgi:hypothetical protein
VTGLVWCVTSVALPLCLIEFGELAPWLARKVVARGASLIVDRDLRERYQEEWREGVEAWPGRLTKLVRAILLVGLAVPRINADIYDAWWQKEIGARISIGVGSRTLHVGFVYAPIFLPFLRGETHSRLAQYNHSLAELCKAIRTADASERIMAIETLEDLALDPPPWMSRSSARSLHDRTLKDLRHALELRGYVTESDEKQD